MFWSNVSNPDFQTEKSQKIVLHTVWLILVWAVIARSFSSYFIIKRNHLTVLSLHFLKCKISFSFIYIIFYSSDVMSSCEEVLWKGPIVLFLRFTLHYVMKMRFKSGDSTWDIISEFRIANFLCQRKIK